MGGKVVLVAGASSGMGKATALAAAATGARVGLFARRADALTELAAAIEDAGGEAVWVAGDATREEDAAEAVARTAERFGRIDVLVNSVGANIPERALPLLTFERWRRLLAANLDAAFLLTQAVLPTFRAQTDGLLIHISSGSAKRGDVSGAAYQASKAGVVGLAQGTMVEERANGVRVTVLFPGLTDTPILVQRPVRPTPEVLATALQPEDVAQMCLAVMALPSRAYVPEVLLYPSRGEAPRP
jgi:NAD(P)-dependent dehydrogenase (short-subunit alcohol dehydrogenase family)